MICAFVVMYSDCLYSQMKNDFSVGLTGHYATMKFPEQLIRDRQLNTENPTDYLLDVLPLLALKYNNRISLLFNIGFQKHDLTVVDIGFTGTKIKTLSLKSGGGFMIRLLGKEDGSLSFNLQSMVNLERFISKTGLLRKSVRFAGTILWSEVEYYKMSDQRISVDINPVFKINITNRYALILGGGYSIGLNKSGSYHSYFGLPYLGRFDSFVTREKESYLFTTLGIRYYPHMKVSRRSLFGNKK